MNKKLHQNGHIEKEKGKVVDQKEDGEMSSRKVGKPRHS